MHEVVMYRACVLNDKTQQGQRIHYSLLSDLSKLPLRLLRVPVKTLPMQSMHGLRPLQDALDHIAKEIEKAMGSWLVSSQSTGLKQGKCIRPRALSFKDSLSYFTHRTYNTSSSSTFLEF